MNINLTKEEAYFLKEFAKKQYEGSKGNKGTRTPIHVVEREYVEFIETDTDGEVWVCSDLESAAFSSIEDLLEAAIKEDLINQRELEKYCKEFCYCSSDSIGVCCSIDEQKDLLSIFSIDAQYGKQVYSYEPVAYFFILDEAIRYKDNYQKHNCDNCRIYTHALGYSNQGDFPVFWNLLMRLGQML